MPGDACTRGARVASRVHSTAHEPLPVLQFFGSDVVRYWGIWPAVGDRPAQQPLERALRDGPVEVHTETVIERVEVPAIDAGTLQRLELLVAALKDTGAELVSVGDRLVAGLAHVQNASAPVSGISAAALAPNTGRSRRVHPRPVLDEPPSRHSQQPSVDAGEVLPRNRQRILDTLATFEALGLRAVHRKSVAVFSGRGPRSSAFDTDLAALSKSGLLVTGGGHVHLTEDGQVRASTPAALPTGEGLRQAWYATLT